MSIGLQGVSSAARVVARAAPVASAPPTAPAAGVSKRVARGARETAAGGASELQQVRNLRRRALDTEHATIAADPKLDAAESTRQFWQIVARPAEQITDTELLRAAALLKLDSRRPEGAGSYAVPLADAFVHGNPVKLQRELRYLRVLGDARALAKPGVTKHHLTDRMRELVFTPYEAMDDDHLRAIAALTRAPSPITPDRTGFSDVDAVRPFVEGQHPVRHAEARRMLDGVRLHFATVDLAENPATTPAAMEAELARLVTGRLEDLAPHELERITAIANLPPHQRPAIVGDIGPDLRKEYLDRTIESTGGRWLRKHETLRALVLTNSSHGTGRLQHLLSGDVALPPGAVAQLLKLPRGRRRALGIDSRALLAMAGRELVTRRTDRVSAAFYRGIDTVAREIEPQNAKEVGLVRRIRTLADANAQRDRGSRATVRPDYRDLGEIAAAADLLKLLGPAARGADSLT